MIYAFGISLSRHDGENINAGFPAWHGPCANHLHCWVWRHTCLVTSSCTVCIPPHARRALIYILTAHACQCCCLPPAGQILDSVQAFDCILVALVRRNTLSSLCASSGLTLNHNGNMHGSTKLMQALICCLTHVFRANLLGMIFPNLSWFVVLHVSYILLRADLLGITSPNWYWLVATHMYIYVLSLSTNHIYIYIYS